MGSKTLLQRNPPVLTLGVPTNTGIQIVLYNGRKMVVVVVVVVILVVMVLLVCWVFYVMVIFICCSWKMARNIFIMSLPSVQ